MKTARKVLLLVLCAALLVSASIMGTLAYLTDSEAVANTFTVGKVGITLDETDVNLMGEKDSDNRVTKNEYKLLPGHSYIKDPTVTVAADSEESYIRMLVTITDFADVKAVLGADFLPQNFVTGWDSEVWVSTGTVVESDGAATYEFRYYTTVSTVDNAALTLAPLFKTIEMPGDIKNEDLAKLEEMDINVVAQAIQADSFDDAAEAWASFPVEAQG